MTKNWEQFDENLKNIKYPHVLIFNFFNIIHLLDDSNASIILRYIIKNNLDIFKIEPYYFLTINLPDEYVETCDVLQSFYLLFINRSKNLIGMKKWLDIYKNKSFWNKNIDEQLVDLYNIRNMTKAIFDNTKSTSSFTDRMESIMKIDNNNSKFIFIESAMERLSQLLKLLGRKVLQSLNIPIITSSEFLDLQDDNKIHYTHFVYTKVLTLLNTIINIFEDFHLNNLKLNNLLNPTFINIEEVDIDEIDDLIGFFC